MEEGSSSQPLALATSSQMSSAAPASATPQSETGGTPQSVPDVSENEVTTPCEGNKKSKQYSDVWVKDFTRLNPLQARCNHCKNTFDAKVRNGTTSLKNHAARCPKNLDRKKEQQSIVLLPPNPGVSAKLVASSYSYDRCRRRLVEFIIKLELPFRIVEAEGLRSLLQEFEPRFPVPSRMTIYRDILEMYIDEKKLLKAYFKANKQRVSLTTDTWTSPNNFNYMCVTVHYVDDKWKLQKRIIMFCLVKGHTGKAIGIMLENCLVDWGLEDVFAVTLDNVNANTVAIDYLKTSVIGWTGAVERAAYLHVRKLYLLLLQMTI